MEPSSFKDSSEEVSYWRKLAEDYKQNAEEVREELDDFQASSRELEYELETQVKQLEKQNQELLLLTEKLTKERDHYREYSESCRQSVGHELTQLQEELKSVKTERERQRGYIRELEQINDDLERAKRAALVSLEDFESQLNKAIERNAILENELDEKEDLIVTVQRLKDETRDLHQELAITRRHPGTTFNGHIVNSIDTEGRPQTKDCKDCLVQTESSVYSNSLFMPSVRLAALNMVNDALQKIGHLEFKLSELYRAQGNHPPLSAPPNSIMTSHPPFPLARRNSNKLARKDRAQMCASNSPLHKWTNGAPNETALLADSQDGSIRTTN